MNHKLKLLLLKSLHKSSVKNPNNTEAGFNLIEVVTVVIIVGILSAIVAPAWDAFVNRQRLRAAQNTVFQAMQSAHSAARGTRSSWQVSFKTDTDDDGNERVYVGLHSVNIAPDDLTTVGEAAGVTENAWYPLAEGIQIYADKADYTKNLVEVAVDPDNLGNNDVMDSFDRDNTYGVLFNYSGCPIVNDGQECTEALGDLTLPMVLTFEHERLGNNANRCVIVQTLIGSMRTAEGEGNEGCQPPDT